MDLDWIKRGLVRPGKSQRGLAKALGLDPAAVNRMLRGGRQIKAREMPIIEDYLQTNGKKIAFPELKSGQREFSLDKLPIVGTGEGSEDGSQPFNGEIVDRVPRPPSLADAPTAYGVYVSGHSMEPRYAQGELIYVHPGKPVTPGCYVLVQMQPKTEGEPPRALIKRLTKRSGPRVILEQFNPPKTFEVQTKDVMAIHRIVGTLE